jgi:hypothetical protein
MFKMCLYIIFLGAKDSAVLPDEIKSWKAEKTYIFFNPSTFGGTDFVCEKFLIIKE